MVNTIAYIGNIVSVFFIFIILARTLLPYFGINYGKFYNFVYQYSEYIMKPIRNRLHKTSRFDYSPIIGILGLYLIKDIFFAPIFYGRISGLEYLFFGEFRIFGILALTVILKLLSSILTFYMVIMVLSILIRKIMPIGTNNYQYMMNSITNPLIEKIRIKLPFNMKKYDYIFAIALILICKILIGEVITFLLGMI